MRGETLNVLGATSGDTGAAAIHGLLGKPGVAIFILYPDGRIAPLQERQMACTGAANVFALAVDGTFDDAQAALKDVFGDQAFRPRHRLSAVNSINLARVLAQCVYYLYAWLRLPPEKRLNVEFVVPTGNFGNVLAGWMLQKMGVPIRGFKIATNQNDILYRLFTTGEYRLAAVAPSLAPSMDIQVASNFERFLYYQRRPRSGARARDHADLQGDGRLPLRAFRRRHASPPRIARTPEISGIIKQVYHKYGYVCDPHTACGFKEISRDRVSVVLATASPAKFPDVIRAAIGLEPTHPSLEALKSRPVVKHPVRADPAAIKAFIDGTGCDASRAGARPAGRRVVPTARRGCRRLFFVRCAAIQTQPPANPPSAHENDHRCYCSWPRRSRPLASRHRKVAAAGHRARSHRGGGTGPGLRRGVLRHHPHPGVPDPFAGRHHHRSGQRQSVKAWPES